MSDQILSGAFKPPAALLQQLKDSEGQLRSMKKIIDALKEMGWDVKTLESTYEVVSRERVNLLKMVE